MTGHQLFRAVKKECKLQGIDYTASQTVVFDFYGYPATIVSNPVTHLIDTVSIDVHGRPITAKHAWSGVWYLVRSDEIPDDDLVVIALLIS